MNEDEVPAPVTLVDLIDRLAEPPEPAPIALTPQTWGWAVLAAMLALALGWLAWRAWRRWRADAYRRSALAALAAAGDDPAAIADILRRAALAAWPRDRVASLTGPDWLAFLDRTGGDFSGAVGAELIAAPYRSSTSPASPALRAAAERWLRRHRRPDAGAAKPATREAVA